VLVGVTVLALAPGMSPRGARRTRARADRARGRQPGAGARRRACPLASAPTGAAFVDAPSVTQQALDAHRFAAARACTSPPLDEGFYPIYATAQ
jgi:hypothetical protein